MLKDLVKWTIGMCLILAATSAWSTGGELGNAFKVYNNFLSEYSIQYPDTWTYLDFGQSVSFAEKAKSTLAESASLTIMDKRFPGVMTIKDLLEHIQFFHPAQKWEPVRISTREGFRASTDRGGIIYLLKSPEQVLSIRFDSAKSDQEQQKIELMLNSLEIK